MALLGVISQCSAIKTADDLHDMYKDPEYADTWRYTQEARYVDSMDMNEWENNAPKAYSFVQTPQQTRREHNQFY